MLEMLDILKQMPGTVELGLMYAFVSLGVYITFRILDFPDLTVDGSFTTGGAVAAVMITHGDSPWLATIAGCCCGLVAGALTGLLHTKGKINGLLSGILMMIALYSVNIRIMGVPNVSMLNEPTVFASVSPMFVMGLTAAAIGLLMILFFRTDLGLALRATGDNERMIRSFGVHTDNTKILGISLSNGLVALSGAFFAQQGGYADLNMGVGMIVIGLASVIIGEAIFGGRSIYRAVLAAILGSIVYRIVAALALRVEWLEPTDMKIITAVIIIVALVIPSVQRSWMEKNIARKRTAQLAEAPASGPGSEVSGNA